MRIARLFLRALALRCPNCGGGGIFASWFHLREHCPHCGLALERQEASDHYLGGMMFNIVLAEVIYLAGMLIWIVATWPNPPWNLVEYLGIPFMVLAPIILYPLSRTIWLAFDLAFRPPRPEEFARPTATPAAPSKTVFHR